MNKRDMENLNLRSAFPDMPQDCRDALLRAARSVEEEKKMKRVPLRAILIAAMLIIATMATAAAASRLLGWADFVNGNSGVPQTAQDAMQLPESEYKVYELGPLSFTVQQLMCDGHIAVATTQVKTTDGSPAILTSEPWDPIGAFGANTKALAQRLGVDPDLTWIEAAKQLNVPLYDVRAILEESTYSGVEMEDPMWDENNDLTYFSMLYLEQGRPEGTLPAQMLLRVARIDLETGERIEEETQRIRVDMEIPVREVLDEAVFQPDESLTVNGFALDHVSAEHTVAGLYVTSVFKAADEALIATQDRDARWEAIHYIWDHMHWLQEDGQEYPGGMNMSGDMNIDAWPVISLEDMISVEETPDTLILACDGQQITLKKQNTR